MLFSCKYFINIIIITFSSASYAADKKLHDEALKCHNVVKLLPLQLKKQNKMLEIERLNKQNYQTQIDQTLVAANYRRLQYTEDLSGILFQPKSIGKTLELTDEYKKAINLARYIIDATLRYTLDGNFLNGEVYSHLEFYQEDYTLLLGITIEQSIKEAPNFFELTESQVYNIARAIESTQIPYLNITSSRTEYKDHFKDSPVAIGSPEFIAVTKINKIITDMAGHLYKVIVKYQGSNKRGHNKHEK